MTFWDKLLSFLSGNIAISRPAFFRAQNKPLAVVAPTHTYTSLSFPHPRKEERRDDTIQNILIIQVYKLKAIIHLGCHEKMLRNCGIKSTLTQVSQIFDFKFRVQHRTEEICWKGRQKAWELNDHATDRKSERESGERWKSENNRYRGSVLSGCNGLSTLPPEDFTLRVERTKVGNLWLDPHLRIMEMRKWIDNSWVKAAVIPLYERGRWRGRNTKLTIAAPALSFCHGRSSITSAHGTRLQNESNIWCAAQFLENIM